MNGTNGNEPGYPENALVPYPVIVAATKGIHRIPRQFFPSTHAGGSPFPTASTGCRTCRRGKEAREWRGMP